MKAVDVLEMTELYLRTKGYDDLDARELSLLRSIHQSVGRIIDGKGRGNNKNTARRRTDGQHLSVHYH